MCERECVCERERECVCVRERMCMGESEIYIYIYI